MNKKIYRIFLLLCVAGAVAAYSLWWGRTAPLVAVHPLRGPAVQTVYATGTVEPSVMIPLSAKTTAHLAELLVDEGETVAKGQILARLENTEQQKKLTEMRSAVDLAQKEHVRRVALFQKKAVSEQAVDQARSALETAIARMEQVQSTLNELALTAPEDSVVIRRDGEIGELIPAGQTVFWLASTKGLRITTEVDEEDIVLVKTDQTVVIRADAFQGRVFRGKVQSITPKGDPVSRSYRVRVQLDEQTPMMIGMTAEANIIIHENKNALLVPASSVRNNTVFKLDKGQSRAVQTKVVTGATGAGVIEIREGIDEQTLVLREASAEAVTEKSIRFRVESWTLP